MDSLCAQFRDPERRRCYLCPVSETTGQQIPATTAPGNEASSSVADVWRGPANFWSIYPIGYGVLGILFASLLLFQGGSISGFVVGAGLASAVMAVFGLITAALLFVARRWRFEGAGKVVGLLSALLITGVAAGAAVAAGIDPMLPAIAAFILGSILAGLGQTLGRMLLFRRPVPTWICAALIVAAIIAGTITQVLLST